VPRPVGTMSRTRRWGRGNLKALLIIDMIKGFISKETGAGECALHIDGAKAIIPNINREIEALDEGDRVIHVCDEHSEDDTEFKVWPKHCVSGTEECEIVDGFVDGPYKKISKTRFSAFFRTELDGFLNNLGNIDEIIVTGVCTDICVFATALDARYRDLKVVVPRDCVFPLYRERGEYLLKFLKGVAGVELR